MTSFAPSAAAADDERDARTERRTYRSRRRRLPLFASALAATTVILFWGIHHARAPVAGSGLSDGGWPTTGQGAYQLGSGAPATSPGEQPVPIASLAKVMTAYLVVRAHPLGPHASGFTMTVSSADAASTLRRAHEDQSTVAVTAGEVMTERQALNALLLPSANNVAVMLARAVAGSVPAFVREMNGAASRLGMDQTTYTDPSGFDPTTVSTAADQLTLARAVTSNHTIAAIVAMPTYTVPVVGTVRNTDTLLGTDGFVGMKTGSETAAGGCFMFHVRRGRRNLVGVILGQQGTNLIDAGLDGARQLADYALAKS